MSLKKKPYNLPYLSLMFITVNHELGYKFITPAYYDMCKFLCQFSFFLSLSFLSYMKTIFQDICSSSLVTTESIRNLRDSLTTFAPG